MSDSADRVEPTQPPEAAGPSWFPLAGARMPADRGMSGLGLVLQLGGAMFAALTAIVGLSQLIVLAELAHHGARVGGDMLWILSITIAGVIRSAAHRSAGSGLLYGQRPVAGIRRYVAIAIAHGALVVAFLVIAVEAPLGIISSVGLALLAWPAILWVVVLRVLRPRGADGTAADGGPAGHRTQSAACAAGSDVGALPLAEDKGFEGAAVLMTLLGTCGVLFIATTLVGLIHLPGRVTSTGPGVFLLVILVMLLVRSVLHFLAGWRGLHEVHIDRAVESANRYADFAIITAFVAAGVFLVILMMQQAAVQGLVHVGGVAWLLLVWPLTIRRFFGDRQFADLLAGDSAPVHRRSPDRGLTALGWLLLAIGAVGVALYLPGAILPRGTGVLTSFGGEVTGRSPWWNVGIHGLELWAGVELVRMSDHHRLATTVFGVVATAVNVYQYLPALESLDGLAAYAAPGAASVVGLGQLALSLVPVAALLLVNRNHVPVARARMRGPARARRS